MRLHPPSGEEGARLRGRELNRTWRSSYSAIRSRIVTKELYRETRERHSHPSIVHPRSVCTSAAWRHVILAQIMFHLDFVLQVP